MTVSWRGSGGVGFADQASRRRLRPEDALPDRLDHEDVHGHRDHAASRRGEAPARRSGRLVPSRARGAREPVRADRDAHDPPHALARVGAAERAARDGLVRAPRTRAIAGRTSRASPEIATRVPPNTQWKYSNLAYQLLGEIVRASRGDSVLGVHPDEAPRAARHDARPRSIRCPPRSACAACDRVRRRASCPTSSSSRRRRPPSFGAEGGLWSCVEDLARWLSFQLRRDGPRNGARCWPTRPEGDAQGRVPRRRGVDARHGHRLVREAARRRRLGAALGRLSTASSRTRASSRRSRSARSR